MKTKTKAWLHGECVLRQATLPPGAVPENVKTITIGNSDVPYTILADSETTGNHHVLELNPGVEFFNEGTTRYFRSDSEMKVRCVLTSRHDTVTLPPGTYQIGFQQEYDYVAESLRNVRD